MTSRVLRKKLNDVCDLVGILDHGSVFYESFIGQTRARIVAECLTPEATRAAFNLLAEETHARS